jgi:hypothetical protein
VVPQAVHATALQDEHGRGQHGAVPQAMLHSPLRHQLMLHSPPGHQVMLHSPRF